MTERGKIRNREFAKQLRDYSGLRYGNKTPTDLDAYLDFGGRAFIFVETKYGDAPLQGGQKLALTRLVDACQAARVESVLLVAEHSDAELTDCGDIDMAICPVRHLYHKRHWHHSTAGLPVREEIEMFLEAHGIPE